MDLNAPLGMAPPPRRRRRAVVLFGGAAAAVLLGGLALVLAGADPRGGRPYMIAVIPPNLVPRPSPLDATPTGTMPPQAASTTSALATAASRTVLPSGGRMESGVMVFRGGGVAPTGPADVSPRQGGTSTLPAVPSGPLVIDVTRALDDPLGKAHGAPAAGIKATGASPAAPAQPRIAIFVSGMGLDNAATRNAIETMPAAVTLAFLPYGASVSASVAAAKAKGHEVLLQLPMRSEGGSSPGPHTLRPDVPADVLKGDLAWLMDRFAGYDGLTNLLGAPVTADTAAMTLVLKAAGARHLYYLDDGTSRQSVSESLASDLSVEAVKTDLVLDATADPAVVRANLDRLVALAKRKGRAIGMASGLPEHLGTIARFATDLGSRGVSLVPVSTIAHGGDPAQATATR